MVPREPEAREEQRASRDVFLWGGIVGVVLLVMLGIWALQSGHHGGLRTENIAEQSGRPPLTSGEQPGTSATGGNPAASRPATTLGSGPPGSGTGSPTGSSSNTTGSSPAGGAARSETTGSSTR